MSNDESEMVFDDLRPSFLIVSADGTDVNAMLPDRPWVDALHTASLVAPTPCRCGATHAPDMRASIHIYVGEPLGLVPPDDAVAIAIVPGSAEHVQLPCATVVERDPSAWKDTVRRVLAYLPEGSLEEGILCYEIADLRAVLSGPGEMVYVRAEAATLDEAIASFLERFPKHRGGPGFVSLGVSGPASMTLRDVTRAADAVHGISHEDDSILFYSARNDAAFALTAFVSVGQRASSGPVVRERECCEACQRVTGGRRGRGGGD